MGYLYLRKGTRLKLVEKNNSFQLLSATYIIRLFGNSRNKSIATSIDTMELIMVNRWWKYVEPHQTGSV